MVDIGPDIWYRKPKKTKDKYWYEFFVRTCVLCGSQSVYKVRRYTPKPTDRMLQYHLEDMACDRHFI